jgi:hypothetical protein
MGDFAKADREVVRVVERIHVRVMSDAAGVVREVRNERSQNHVTLPATP